MQEKEIVNDVLSMTKSSMNTYEVAISECSNQQLRSALQQLRDGAEQFQYQLYQIAEKKGYYAPAQAATQQEIQDVKSNLMQG
ncbi:putative spore coat protein, CotF-like protein [Gottschalkia purinilytica]|uniref:Putative spore coat protein, CotF-like protein n=1 Tax=Gottschalkia purinilytica TaxID=1503 RepID=A0A0L0W6Q7_GOTPU|nr:spore coat protein [Gottschalkia purinilytica]KNF07209.1 putative spore coat protein, CotF-like protein [Gottschalkia purinilytica]